MSGPLVKPPRVCVLSYCRGAYLLYTVRGKKKHLLYFTRTRVGEVFNIIVIPLLPAHVGLGRRRRRSGSQIVGTTATADAAAACLADRETSLPPVTTRLPLKYNKVLCTL